MFKLLFISVWLKVPGDVHVYSVTRPFKGSSNKFYLSEYSNRPTLKTVFLVPLRASDKTRAH